MVIQRQILEEFRFLLRTFPAIMLTGPRQVGKTTVSQQVGKLLSKPVHYLDLERAQDRAALGNDIEMYLTNYEDHCVVIDEAQTLPELFTALRPLIDRRRQPARFVLLGSANPALVKGISETLAGRIIYLEIGQINLQEATKAKISMNDLWFRGGFPDALLSKSYKTWSYWTESFISTYIHRDLNFLFGVSLTPEVIQRIWTMIAHLNGEQENAEKLGRSLGITGTTVKRYLDYLEGAYLIHRLPAWFTNGKKRLVKSKKLYLRTTGILHHLLEIPDRKKLLLHPGVGTSWEAYVVEQVYQLKARQAGLYYYRTHEGAESDLVLIRGIKPVCCIEIKFTNSPTVSRGFYECIKDLKTKRNYVITPGGRKWTTKTGLTVLPLEQFLSEELPKI